MQKERQNNPCNTIKSSYNEESVIGFAKHFTKPESKTHIKKKHEGRNQENDNNIRYEGRNNIRCFIQGFKF